MLDQRKKIRNTFERLRATWTRSVDRRSTTFRKIGVPGLVRYPVVKCYQFLVLAMASRKNFEDEKISLTRLRYLVYKHFLTFDFQKV